MSVKIKNMLASLLVLIILIIIVVTVIHIYFNPDSIIPRSSIKWNIWALTRWENQLDLTVYERNIQTRGKKAIPYLEECVRKYQNKGEYERAERCSIVMDSIKNNSSN